jgi:LysR family transcriptional regulator, glycine cleavage system transcriptional activator
VCSPTLLAGQIAPRAADLLNYPLIHYDWFSGGADTPTWRKWWATARTVDPKLPDLREVWAFRFSEELHALDAVIAGQGIAICGDIVLADALRDETLCRAHELTLPGLGFYLTHLPDTPRRPIIDAFHDWIKLAA